MLTGFEEITHDLSDKEKDQAGHVWRVMQHSFLNGQSITNAEISSLVEDEYGYSLSGPRIRKMINWMHTEGHLPRLIATSKGYSRAKTAKELLDYLKSIEGRLNSIHSRYKAIQRDLSQFDHVAQHPVQKKNEENKHPSHADLIKKQRENGQMKFL